MIHFLYGRQSRHGSINKKTAVHLPEQATAVDNQHTSDQTMQVLIEMRLQSQMNKNPPEPKSVVIF